MTAGLFATALAILALWHVYRLTRALRTVAAHIAVLSERLPRETPPAASTARPLLMPGESATAAMERALHDAPELFADARRQQAIVNATSPAVNAEPLAVNNARPLWLCYLCDGQNRPDADVHLRDCPVFGRPPLPPLDAA